MLSGSERASTSYMTDGQVQQMKLGNSATQTVDYTYTVQGWLDKINDGTISTSTNGDRFGMNLNYNYNGNISLQQWAQVGTSGTNQNTLSYTYSYDTANRLTNANFSGSGYNSNAFDVSNLVYDKNGNIKNYIRRNQSGSAGATGYMTMNIASGNNRLNYLEEGANYTQFDTDYDASGNMIENELNGFSSVDYDWRNLPAQMIAGANTLQYAYDAEGNRVKKKVVSGTETHYVRGAGGETIAVYEDDSITMHNILAGADIIGFWDGTDRRYFLKDHLGSIRTTIDQSGAVVGYDDYSSALYDVLSSDDITFQVAYSEEIGSSIDSYNKYDGQLYGGGKANLSASGGDIQVDPRGNMRAGEPSSVILLHELVGHGHPVATPTPGNINNAHDINRFYMNKLGLRIKAPYRTSHRGYKGEVKWPAINLYKRN